MISIVYITCRYEPRIDWFCDTLLPQFRPDERPQVVVVAPEHSKIPASPQYSVVRPKPTIWSGPHRITKEDWWSAANARNTGICYAEGDFIVFLDDRSAFYPGWVDCLREAIAEKRVVCGAYHKVSNLKVSAGKIESFEPFPDRDNRIEYVEKYWVAHFKSEGPFDCPGEWTYGCSLALPLEWALNVGGFDETCDGVSMEDSIFGLMLQNHQYHITFDPRMKMLEDRTGGQLAPQPRRADKGVSPNDKSHAMLARLRTQKHVLSPVGIRRMRDETLAGIPFSIVTEPQVDWYDGQPIRDFA